MGRLTPGSFAVPFRDFTFPDAVTRLGLKAAHADLFAATPPAAVPSHVAEQVADGAGLATAIGTEKARSEFVIAPVLQELRRQHRGEFALFSGVPLEVDPVRGLNGVCDFLITRSSFPFTPTAPLLALVEAKNADPREGLGQRVATMVALREFNAVAGEPLPAVYGASTTGVLWRFAKLVGTDLTIDEPEYQVSDLGKILGILASIVRKPA